MFVVHTYTIKDFCGHCYALHFCLRCCKTVLFNWPSQASDVPIEIAIKWICKHQKFWLGAPVLPSYKALIYWLILHRCLVTVLPNCLLNSWTELINDCYSSLCWPCKIILPQALQTTTNSCSFSSDTVHTVHFGDTGGLMVKTHVPGVAGIKSHYFFFSFPLVYPHCPLEFIKLHPIKWVGVSLHPSEGDVN